MKRINTVSWIDGLVITRHMNSLQEELMKWQRDCAREDPENPGMLKSVSEIHSLCGDSSVLVAAITLRNRLNEIIEKSATANEV